MPTAEVDSSGRVYVAWSDCVFESGCNANDIVMTSSTDGVSWTPVVRIPTDPLNSGVDHFIPGLAVDPNTGGSAAHLALTYYYFPAGSSELSVGFSSSLDGGATWTAREADRRADAPAVGREHEPGLHGRRLHLDVVHGRRQGASRLLARQAAGLGRERLLLPEQHRVPPAADERDLRHHAPAADAAGADAARARSRAGCTGIPKTRRSRSRPRTSSTEPRARARGAARRGTTGRPCAGAGTRGRARPLLSLRAAPSPSGPTRLR